MPNTRHVYAEKQKRLDGTWCNCIYCDFYSVMPHLGTRKHEARLNATETPKDAKSPSHSSWSLFLSLSILVLTLIRCHIAGSSPPSPLRLVPCIFIGRRLQHFLPSSASVKLIYTCTKGSRVSPPNGNQTNQKNFEGISTTRLFPRHQGSRHPKHMIR